jgi:hypothetical protein
MRKRLPDELAHELLAGANSEEEIVGPGGLGNEPHREACGHRMAESQSKDPPGSFSYDRRLAVDWRPPLTRSELGGGRHESTRVSRSWRKVLAGHG